MADPPSLHLVQFLTWLAARPRRYGEVKDAWRSTCPRLTAWEDAVEAGLVRFENAAGRLTDESLVGLTARGRDALATGGRMPLSASAPRRERGRDPAQESDGIPAATARSS